MCWAAAAAVMGRGDVVSLADGEQVEVGGLAVAAYDTVHLKGIKEKLRLVLVRCNKGVERGGACAARV
jgi:hypothetical protein